MRIFFLALVWALLLTACGGGASDPPPPAATASLSISQATVSNGASATLTWSSTNATSCAASGDWTGAKPVGGSQSTGALTAATRFSLTCTGPGGAGPASTVSVGVIPTVTLSASAASVPAGGSAELSWASANASSCAATGAWSGALPTSGTQSTGALSQPGSYSIACSGPAGTSDIATVSVNVAPTVTFSANPPVVAAGGSSLLTWSSLNATACDASGGWSGSKAPSGTVSSGAISASTTYSLTCSGAGGSSAPVTVTVVSGSVNLSPALATITVAQTAAFNVTVPGGAVVWSVDGITGGNTTVGTVSPAGVYTPGAVVGSHKIGAASVAYPSLGATAVAVVTDLSGVFTYHNDLARDGANTQEYALTPANVNAAGFGRLFSCPVDGAVYAQPLWAPNIAVQGAPHNAVFVATQHDGLFAFDADANPCQPLWAVSLIDTAHGGLGGETSVPSGVPGYLVGRGLGDITPEVGVTGTPVIDPATHTLYVVSKSVDAGATTLYQRLHAIDMATGGEKPGSPVAIAATFAGTGDGGSVVSFDPRSENQRAALALVNGVVYVAWAAHEDVAPWYGWVMGYAYDGTAFTQTAVFNVDPNSQQGGVWMSGAAPAADADGNLYLVTGNGNFNASNLVPPNTEYGDSLLRLGPALTVSQYFTPSDQSMDMQNDADFGAGGAAVLADLPAGSPIVHLIVCGGKDGSLYVLDRDALGGLGDAAAVQKIAFGEPIFGTGAYWNGTFYLGGNEGPLNAFTLNPAAPQFVLAASSAHVYGRGGTTPSVSAAGTVNGIVWALDNQEYCTTLSAGCGPAVLYAYDATNVGTLLWSSAGVAADAAGNAVKFTVPTVANGKVYVGTRGNNSGGVSGSTSVPGELDVYGLKSAAAN